ncbi:MAG TPA: carboxypeptidase-like regulatory domain-containing protein, partial [Chitinophagales bacterium]
MQAQDFATLRGTLKNAKGKPLDFVNVVVKEQQELATQSNEQGNYELKIPANKTVTVIFSSLNIRPFQKQITLQKDEISTLNLSLESKENVFNEVKIVDESSRTQASMSDVKVDNMLLPSADGGIESFIAAQALGFNKANELSANYSVRGGSYDENLVYVNGFEIYRPYLMRSGQQEGLSFPNSNMVNNIKFSSGGFQSQYGDKLSSVMDVTYKRPKAWGGSASASIMGFTATLEGCDKSKRFSFVAGFRQKMGTYLFNTLDTKGQYNPNFIDFQLFATYLINEKWSVEILSNYSRNQYSFVPNTQSTKFGSVSDVKELEIAYEGQENDLYSSFNNGVALNFFPKENIKLKLLASAYNDDEREQYDILSDYRIGDVETDPGKSNYGKVTSFDGYGGIHDYARNRLQANVYRAALSGTWVTGKHTVMFGADYKHEQINDRLNQWELLDSAGYSLPYDDASKSGYGDSAFVSSGSIAMNSVLKSTFHLNSNRISAFIQDTWRLYEDRITFNYGLRFQYWDVNKEPFVTPRVQFSFKPKAKADLVFTLSGGLYFQAPFYREMRAMDGTINTNLKSQKSAQVVGGMSYGFKAWNRPFLFATEVYYKYLWDLDPYQYTNVLIRYFANNNGKGFATGIDARLNGQLAEGLESWISISVMGT